MTRSVTLAVDVEGDLVRVFGILSTTDGQRAFWTVDCGVSADRARFGSRWHRLAPAVSRPRCDVAVDVRPVVLVRRPRAEVAAFMFDPHNDLRWTGGITSSTPAQPGPLVKGATVERTARFLGRTFTYGYVVTQHQPDRLVELAVTKPFPMTVRYELDDTADGTLVAIHANGRPGRFFRWATPVMTRQVRKSITGDLERLRACLET